MQIIKWPSGWIVFGGYFLIVFVLYWQIIPVYFVSDDFYFLYEMEDSGIKSILNNFNDAFFIPLAHFYGYLLWSIFHLNPIGYNIAGILLHSINAFLLYTLQRNIYYSYNKKIEIERNHAFLIIWFSSLLFLINPYQIESVAWFSSRSYLLAVFFVLLSAIQFVRFFTSESNKSLLYSILFMFLALLSKESVIAIPPVFIVIALVIKKSQIKTTLKLTILFSLVLIFYWIIRMIVLDDWVGGYGLNTHFSTTPKLLIYNLLAYFVKFFVLWRFLPDYFTSGASIFFKPIFWFLIFGLICFTTFRWKTIISHQPNIILFSLFIFVMSLLPVISLETSFLGNMQSDRYGYLASIPAMFIFVYFCFYTLKKNIFLTVMIFIVLLFSVLTIKTNSKRVKAGELAHSIGGFLQEKVESDKVFFLNLPDNYCGAYVLRVGFNKYLQILGNFNSETNFSYGVLQHFCESGITSVVNWQGDSLILTLSDDESYFMNFNPNLQTNLEGAVHLTSFSNKKAVFVIKEPKVQIFYLNKGSVFELDDK